MIAVALWQAAVAGPVLPVERPKRDCRDEARADPADIVVCGKGQEQFRLRPLAQRYDADAAAIPKAETTLGGAKMAVEAEAASIGGVVSNRAMVRLKLPF